MEIPSTASQTYRALHTTALEFVHALDLDDTLPERYNQNRLRAICAPGFRHDMGHAFFLSTAPHLVGTKDVDGFVRHLGMMMPMLHSWQAKVTDCVVDEAQLRVVLRGSYYMRVKGKDGEVQEVENDLVWWITMVRDEDADKNKECFKVARGIEFVDAAASKKLKELATAAKAL